MANHLGQIRPLFTPTLLDLFLIKLRLRSLIALGPELALNRLAVKVAHLGHGNVG